MSISLKIYKVTTDFLTALQAEGVVVTTDKYLSIQTLLNKFSDDITVQDWKLAIVPILAHSSTEQSRFYAIFDDCLQQTDLPEESELPRRPLIVEIISFFTVLALIIGCIWAGYNIYNHVNNLTPKTIEPNVNIDKPIDTNTVNNPTNINTATYFVENKPYPFPNHLFDYSVESTPIKRWFSENWYWLRWLLMMAWVLAFYFLFVYIVKNQKQLIARPVEKKRKRTLSWDIHIPNLKVQIDQLFPLMQVMKRRADLEIYRFNIPLTIEATTLKAGFAEPKFRSLTTSTEYLLLIDSQSFRNHRARLFDELYLQLKAQDVDISRYFYDSDLRTCFKENRLDPYGTLTLTEIYQLHHQARLIIIGSGLQMLSPISGKPLHWTEFFYQWKERVLLSPKPFSLWGYDEYQLKGVFDIFPATAKTLFFWVSELEKGQNAQLELWKKAVKDAPQTPIQVNPKDPMTSLKLYFEEPMLLWIAACAIFPSLHWDLTCFLSQKVDSYLASKDKNYKKPPLSNFDNLLQLTRLSWFINGEIPSNETRLALLTWLNDEHPTLLYDLRLAIAEVLQDNPPPADDINYLPFRLNSAIVQWSSANSQEKKLLKSEIDELLANEDNSEFMLVEIKGAYDKSPLDFVLPNAWKRFYNSRKLKVEDWLQSQVHWRWALPLFLVGLIALFYPYKFKTIDCESDKLFTLNVSGQNYSFCLNDPFSALTYQEQYIRSMLNSNNYNADSIESLFLPDKLVGGYENSDFTISKTTHFSLFKASSDITIGKGSMLESTSTRDLAPLSIGALLNDAQRGDALVQKLLRERNSNFAVDYYRLAKRHFEKGRKDSACYFLKIAAQFDSLDNDIKLTQALICDRNEPIPFQNSFLIEGEVLGSALIPLTDDTGAALSGDDDNILAGEGTVPLANVQIRYDSLSTLSDATGYFRLTLPPQYQKPNIDLTFIKKGYQTQQVMVAVPLRNFINLVLKPIEDNSNTLVPYKSNGLSGYRKSKSKEIVIPPQYQDAHSFLEGLAAVKVGKQWGFIDATNKMVIQPQFGYAYAFSEGMCLITDENNLKGYIDKLGRVVITPQYKVAERFKNGIARVNSTMCIDKTGKQVNCGSSQTYSSGECVTIQQPVGLTGRFVLRSRPLSDDELKIVTKRIRTLTETSQSLRIDKETQVDFLSDGENVVFLEQIGNWYKIRKNNGVQGFLVSNYSGNSTIKKGCGGR